MSDEARRPRVLHRICGGVAWEGDRREILRYAFTQEGTAAEEMEARIDHALARATMVCMTCGLIVESDTELSGYVDDRHGGAEGEPPDGGASR